MPTVIVYLQLLLIESDLKEVVNFLVEAVLWDLMVGLELVLPAMTRKKVLTATVNLMEARRLNWNAMNVVLRDRRTDLYAEDLGSGCKISHV